jgi:hypothetical protein
MRLIVETLQALPPLNEKVNDRANKVCKDDNDDPDYFGVALVRFFGSAIDQHPQPKKKPEQS